MDADWTAIKPAIPAPLKIARMNIEILRFFASSHSA
jgi:hypothetical protein